MSETKTLTPADVFIGVSNTPPEIGLFLANLEEKDFVKNTIDHYRQGITSFFEWFTRTTGQTEVATVTPLDIRQFRDHLKKTQKAATVNGKIARLSGLFRWCVQQGFIASNPTENIKRSKVSVMAPKWLTRPETYTILRMAEQQLQLAQTKQLGHSELMAARTLAMVRLMLNAGLRAGEICNLKLDDIKLGDKSGSVLIRYGKGSKQRQVPLNLDARKAVQTWLKVRGKDKGEYLFIGPDGDKMNQLIVTWHISQLGKKAEIHLHPHRLRHTFGKNLVDSGIPLDRVAMLLGHANLTTTAVYTMPSQNDLQKAVDKISWED